MKTVYAMGESAREAADILSSASESPKNEFLVKLSERLLEEQSKILSANNADRQAAERYLSTAMIDRLTLSPERIQSIANDAHNVAKLSDPIGEVFEKREHPNGLKIRKERIPIGVIGVIYESRPNVTIDSACLMIKSGNTAILRGGKETIRTNQVFCEIIQQSLNSVGLPDNAIQLIDDPDRTFLVELLQLDQYVDMIIPRGGAGLHQFCKENSRMPVITGGIGICHLFIDDSADIPQSIPVIINAKTQRPTVCNALDTILVHRRIANEFLPQIAALLQKENVLLKADDDAFAILSAVGAQMNRLEMAKEGDFDTEWLSLVLGIKIVDSVEEAIQHIRKHSTGHSDGILTQTPEHATRFCQRVHSACVYVNASTRFTDGSELGLGSEIAISTQPLHARGPMALRELTTYKWVIEGNYHTRK